MIGKVIAAGSFSLLGGLIAYAPAAKLVPQLVPDNAGIQLYELQGTLLHGQAGRISARGVNADDLKWDLQPTRLLLGQAAAHINVSHDSEDLQQDNAWIRADVRYALSGKQLSMRDVAAAAPSEALQQALKISYLPVSGTLKLAFSTLDLDLNSQPTPWPLDVAGSLELVNTQWKLGTPAPLGRFAADIASDDEGNLILEITDNPQAKIALRGNASISSDRSYQTQLQIKPKKDTPANVANQMKALGRTDSQGWYPIKQSGRLPSM